MKINQQTELRGTTVEHSCICFGFLIYIYIYNPNFLKLNPSHMGPQNEQIQNKLKVSEGCSIGRKKPGGILQAACNKSVTSRAEMGERLFSWIFWLAPPGGRPQGYCGWLRNPNRQLIGGQNPSLYRLSICFNHPFGARFLPPTLENWRI